MVDAAVSKTVEPKTRAGSSPAPGTNSRVSPLSIIRLIIVMKVLVCLCLVVAGSMAFAQSLHFRLSDHVPFQQIAQSFGGRITEPRIDVLRSKRDWDEYYSAQNGFFGGAVVTSLIQPDFCKEQVIAINFGSTGTQGLNPTVLAVKEIDFETWEVLVDSRNVMSTAPDAFGTLSPYVAIRTPLGPDSFVFRFKTNSGEEVISLESRRYFFPIDFWPNHGRRMGL